jgi:malonyl-CoA O-methyltransferase
VSVTNAFDQASLHYDGQARLQKQVAAQMDEALSWVLFSPKKWLDLGCGTGFLTEKILARYPDAQGHALDVAPGMLEVLAGKKLPVTSVLSDAHALPFEDNQFDLIVSNLMLQWTDFKVVSQEVMRLLKPGGLFVFSTLGPDTLQELNQSWQQADEPTLGLNKALKRPRTLAFSDMHDLGDILRATAFVDVVMQADPIILDFSSPMALMRHLKTIGASALPNRFSGLTTPRQLKACFSAYEAFKDKTRGTYPATFEILYGHAWCSQNKQRTRDFPLPVEGA